MTGRHPHGVEPSGNMLLREDGGRGFRRERLGPYLAVLSDCVILACVQYLETASLLALCTTSIGLRAFASFEELWKGIGLQLLESGRRLVFCNGSWKTSVLGRPCDKARVPRRLSLYSDLLYQPFRWVHELPAPAFTRLLPADNVRRVSVESTSRAEFAETFESGSGRPAILEDTGFAKVAAEPIWDELKLRFGERLVHAGGINWPLSAYLAYAAENCDEEPLYVFDKDVPDELRRGLDFFDDDDLFRYCKVRPDFNWLLIGGPRTGSSWHVDPNGTSAWNAVIRGAKAWLFLPPHVTPPGVHPSPDGLEIVAPRSSAEWLANFLANTLRLRELSVARAHPGDVVFVPRGWWHMVINLDSHNVALTRNFCSPYGLKHTLHLLRTKPFLVSGLSRSAKHLLETPGASQRGNIDDKTLLGACFLDHLTSQLKQHRPDLLTRVEAQLQQPSSLWARVKRPLQTCQNSSNCRQEKIQRPIVASGDTVSSSLFSFGFFATD